MSTIEDATIGHSHRVDPYSIVANKYGLKRSAVKSVCFQRFYSKDLESDAEHVVKMIESLCKAAGLITVDHGVFDKRGVPIMPGDVLKVYHYTTAVKGRDRKIYMYKVAALIPDRGLSGVAACELGLKPLSECHSYVLKTDKADFQILRDTEVIAGFYGSDNGEDYSDRKKIFIVPLIKSGLYDSV